MKARLTQERKPPESPANRISPADALRRTEEQRGIAREMKERAERMHALAAAMSAKCTSFFES